MADKIPLKGIFDGSGNITGLGELSVSNSDTIGVTHGGTGLATVTANKLLTGNGTSALAVEANLTFDGSSNTLTTPNVSISTAATLASAKISDLTATRIPVVGTAGEIEDDSGLTWASNTLTATNLSVGTEATLASVIVSDLTNNRIVFAGTSGAIEDSANLTFDGTTLQVTGHTTISGNLTIQGNFTETIKIATEDPIMILNTGLGSGNILLETDTPGAPGSIVMDTAAHVDDNIVNEESYETAIANAYDSGFVTERGTSTNVAFIWDESEDLFNFITTTDTGAVSGDINVTAQAAIKAGNITALGDLQLATGQSVNEISNDETFAGGDANTLVTESAAKLFIAAQASAFAIALG